MSPTLVLLVILGSIPAIVLIAIMLRRNAAALEAVRHPQLEGFAQARRASIAALRDHPDEVVHLVGVVRGASASIAPATGRPCAAHEVVVEAIWGRGRSHLLVESAVVDFELQDDTGVVRVRGEGAVAALVTGSRTVEPVPPELAARALELIATSPVQPRGLSCTETIGVTGDRVAVLARVPGQETGAPFRSSDELVLTSTANLQLVVTNHRELINASLGTSS